MDQPTKLAMKLLLDGFVVVPDVIVGDELNRMRDAFEREAARRGKREVPNEECAAVPEFAGIIGHPRLMPVVEAFMRHYGHEPALATLGLCRDIFTPGSPPPPPFQIPTDNCKVTLHNDGAPGGRVALSYDTLQRGCACLFYLDDTYPDAGSIIQAVGSHHLSYRGDDGGVISPDIETVQDSCKLEFIGVKAGGVAIQRAFNWHNAGPPPRHHRRQIRTDYTPRALYDNVGLVYRPGLHMRFDASVLTHLPESRHKYMVIAEQNTSRGL
jgi:hypothetical protein